MRDVNCSGFLTAIITILLPASNIKYIKIQIFPN